MAPQVEQPPGTQRSSELSETTTIHRRESEDVEKDVEKDGEASDANENNDVEKQQEKGASDEEDEGERDPNIVEWDGDDDTQVRSSRSQQQCSR